MEITAKLLECMATVQVSERFRKREFVVEYSTNPDFTECIKFELTQDRCELLDGFEVGQEVRIEFDLKGRRWTDPQGNVKYFNSLRAWRLSITVENSESKENITSTASSPSAIDESPIPENLGPPETDEIPF